MPGLYASLWNRCTKNLLLGAAASVLPALAFYSVSFHYTREQLLSLIRLMPIPVAAFLTVDLLLNTLYLRPLKRLPPPGEATAGEVAAAWRRVHNLPLFSFLRVFGPHAIVATAVAQACVYWANRRWNLNIPASDYWIYWLLSLTLAPIGHAVYEYHANGLAARDTLHQMAARGDVPEHVPGVRRIGLAVRLGVFFLLLGLSPLALTWIAGTLRPVGLEGRDLLVIGAGSVALNFFLLLLFAREVAEQTGLLTRALTSVGQGNLDTHAESFSPDEFGSLARGINRMIHGLRDRERIRNLFGMYVSPEVSQAVIDGKVHVEGEMREVTVLFLDIRDFTRFSANNPPTAVVAMLNIVFASMQEVLQAHGGTIDKFLGDGFMAVFNAPLDCPGHARRAVEAALEMERRTAQLNRELNRDGRSLDIGIGIDTGMVVAGNVGAEDRKEYTVIGDAVNRASRIEQHNRAAGTRILISEHTWLAAGLDGGRSLPPVQLKGLPEALTLYTVGEKL